VILGDHCQVGDNVTLFQTVVGENCKIDRGCIIKNSILWKDVKIGQNCELMQDVIGRQVVIENGCVLDQNVFISDGSKIGANTHVNANVKIWPNKEVDVGSVVNASLVWGDKWQRELFTDSRVTGLANFEISPEFGAKLGAAFGAWIGKSKSVLVSRDATPAARMIYRSVISGILSAGVNVENVQDMAIPIVRYTLHSASEQGGLHVRRSPFDRNLLDILFFDRSGRDFSPGITKAIERIYYREDFPRVSFDEVGRIDYPVRVAQSYAQDFLEHIDLSAIESAKFKIVIDYSFGAATQIFPSILGSLDCEVISLNAFLDPERLTRSASEFADALKQLAKIVKSTSANMGFLIDAGAEKVFCVDEKGEIIPSERLATLISRLYLENLRSEKMAVPVSVPSQVETFAREHATEILYTSDDGGSLMKATEDPAVNFVLDTKGGFIFPEFHFAFDGMYAVVKILEMLAKAKTTLRKLNTQIPKRAFAMAQVPCPWEAKGKVMRRLDEDSQGQRRLLVDGVRINFEDAWVLVLPDRDRAGYHILAEAGNNGAAEKLVAQYQQKLAGWIGNK
jgi:mannose-1-phosphate guanylyltransferase/phosphomannomutase